MYKGASQNAQHARENIRMAEIASASAPDVLTPEQERESVKAALRAIEPQIIAAPLGSPQRRELNARKTALQARLLELGPARLRGVDLAGYFIRAARDYLPRHTYEMLFKQAQAAWEADPKREGNGEIAA